MDFGDTQAVGFFFFVTRSVREKFTSCYGYFFFFFWVGGKGSRNERKKKKKSILIFCKVSSAGKNWVKCAPAAPMKSTSTETARASTRAGAA